MSGEGKQNSNEHVAKWLDDEAERDRTFAERSLQPSVALTTAGVRERTARRLTDPTTATAAEPETERAKRERRDMPARVFVRVTETTWRVCAGPFAGITEAEAWIRRQGEDGQVYWPLRGPAQATQIEPRRFVEVPA